MEDKDMIGYVVELAKKCKSEAGKNSPFVAAALSKDGSLLDGNLLELMTSDISFCGD